VGSHRCGFTQTNTQKTEICVAFLAISGKISLPFGKFVIKISEMTLQNVQIYENFPEF